MKNVDHAQSVMNMIMPRMEIKKVNHVQENFKETLERGKKEFPRAEKSVSKQKTRHKTEARSELKSIKRKSENPEPTAPNKPKESQERLNEREPLSLGQQSQTSEKESSLSVDSKPKTAVQEDKRLQDGENVSLQEQSQSVEENPLQTLLQLKRECLPQIKEEAVSEEILHAADAPKNEKSVLNLPKESVLSTQSQDVLDETGKATFEPVEQENRNLEKMPEYLLQPEEEKNGQLLDNIKQSPLVSEEVLGQQDKTVSVPKEKEWSFEQGFIESKLAETQPEQRVSEPERTKEASSEQQSFEPEWRNETTVTSLSAIRPQSFKEKKGTLKESAEQTRPEQQMTQSLKVTIREELDMLKNQYLGQEASEEEKGVLQKKTDLSEIKEEVRFTLSQLKTSTLNMMVDRNKSVGAQRTNFDLASRVMDEVKISLGQNKTQMQIKLYPETLGKLTIKLSSENGVMNASFFAENDKAKLIIESQMAELRKILENQGIQVQNLSVTVDSGHEELARHKNLMEAQTYSKIKGLESETDTIPDLTAFRNPYIIEDEFTERI